MSIAMIVLLYIIILTIVMRKTNQSLAHHHNHHKPKHKWTNCVLYILFIFSLLTFEILLTNKLDQEMMPFSSSSSSSASSLASSPLSFIISGGGNGGGGGGSSLLSPQSSHVYLGSFHNHQSMQPIVSQNTNTNRNNDPSAAASSSSTSSSTSSSSSSSPLFQMTQNSKLSSALNKSFINFPHGSSSTLLNNNNNNLNQNNLMNSYSHTQHFLNLTYFQVSLPLYLVYFSLMLLSLNNHSGNTLWFGMRRDFCDYFLIVCPVFKTYGNVQIKWSFHDDNSK